MNKPYSRRQFLSNVGTGTLMASIGPALASELGLTSTALAAEAASAPNALAFGEMESLVCFMQETPVAKLQPALLAHLKAGVPLPKLLSAAALANARTFGGEDYVGFHTLMALSPSLVMSKLMPESQAALPVFKVLYRNTNRIQEEGCRAHEVLHTVPVDAGAPLVTGEQLRNTVKTKNTEEAERQFAALVAKDPRQAFDALLMSVQENLEVHRTVLPYRAWELLEVVGMEHAHTLLRQSLRYCLEAEGRRHSSWDAHGQILAKMLDEHKLLGKELGNRIADDSFVEQLANTIFRGTSDQAAAAAAGALAEGFSPAVVGEAICLATNQIVLRDMGRPPQWEAPGKPPGSVHGDSPGVHACDAANAWRHMALASQGRNAYACLILSAWAAARDKGSRLLDEPVPSKRQVGTVSGKEQAVLLGELEEAIRGNLQGQASAVVQRYGEFNFPDKPVFDLLLRYAVSEDGSLHAEKYFFTAWDEFHASRPAFRWRQAVALARVTASEYGRPAPGQVEARELLGVTVV